MSEVLPILCRNGARNLPFADQSRDGARVAAFDHHRRFSQLHDVLAPRIQIRSEILHATRIEDQPSSLRRVRNKGRPHATRSFLISDDHLDGAIG